MTAQTLEQELAEMTSAEDFLNYFEIAFNPKIVEVNRLHILQRFHDYLQQTNAPDRADYVRCLQSAYQDFVDSDALTEKVFKVFHRQAQRGEVRISLADIGRPA
ncbi:MAG TPA: nitrogenase-stabilizing/protective protein NifW [Candidatus Competibacter sp.]|jgi:nitrogenase-stabilizing/protective protein|nr:nitrogenase-stabilizing/protective protein NifW [Candidatus Competibacter sp.]HRF63668.1 nitrogenase-stabilizing/protective protein NifW [Candidatus Competibacter sp.]HRX62722.1 nitrogenase-stabilizing/protective protein NifW [Candidatus Competibacter sp.]